MQGASRIVDGSWLKPERSFEDQGPYDAARVGDLVDELSEAINHADVFMKRMQLAEDSAWCQWEGQQDDGQKHADGEDDVAPFPWEGASDTRIRLVEEYTRKSIRVCNAAFERGRWKFAGTEQADEGWAQRASLVLRWLVFTKMRPMAQRERKLALYWRNALGLSFTLVDWEECSGYQLADLNLKGLMEAFGLGPIVDFLEQRGETAMQFIGRIESQGGAAEELAAYDELKNALELALNPAREAELVETLRTLFPTVKKAQLREAARELRTTGMCRLPQPYVARSRPVWRALKPMRDGFVPMNTTAVEHARWFAVRDFYSKSELKDRAREQEWDAKAVDYLLEKGDGLNMTEALVNRVRENSKRYVSGRASWESGTQERAGLFEVFTFYYWGTDDFGVRGLYKCILSAALFKRDRGKGSNPDGEECVLHHGLADLDHGKLPVVEHVFYRDSELLMECVGLPYLLYTYQNEVKTQRDARIDHSSISILPPVRRHVRDKFTPLTIAPGSPIHEAMMGSTEWMRPPENRSLQSVELEEAVKQDAARIAGGMHGEIPAPEVQLHQQEMANDYLDECVELLSLTFQTAQQFLTRSVVARVSGPAARAFEVSGEEIRGEFDFRIVFDARELDTEFAQAQGKMAADILMQDTTGLIDRTKAVPALLSLVSAEWAEDWIKDPQQAQRDEIEDEMGNLSMILNGLEPPMRPSGQNAELRKQVLLSQVQGERANPMVIERLQENEQVLKIFQTRVQHLDFVHKEKTEYKQAGSVGARPALAG